MSDVTVLTKDEAYAIAEFVDMNIFTAIRTDEDLICPVCGADVEWKRYCEECGQRIDTGDES